MTRKIFSRLQVLVDEGEETNYWAVEFMTMFHMANDSALFRLHPQRSNPLYEGKMFISLTTGLLRTSP